MKYIIMCGGVTLYNIKEQGDDTPRPFRKIYGERLIDRTIRLLQANGVKDISISSNSSLFDDIGVPVLRHDNSTTWEGYVWLHCFYPVNEPVCYLYGDVFYSDNAIRTIVETETDDIEFFASSPPFADQYIKNWAEPFAFKVRNTEWFFACIRRAIYLHSKGEFRRPPISWELWQVIKGTPLNAINYRNYKAINDYTVDIDGDKEVRLIEKREYGKP